jgi:hypothetical protein
MPICGAKTNDDKQCERPVSEPGKHCDAHSDVEAETLASKVISVCNAVSAVAGTIQAVDWAYRHLWPHVQPLFDANLFCPEHFWWDGIAAPAQGNGDKSAAPQRLRRALEEMQHDHAKIVQILSGYSIQQRERIADAYEKVAFEIRANPEVIVASSNFGNAG